MRDVGGGRDRGGGRVGAEPTLVTDDPLAEIAGLVVGGPENVAADVDAALAGAECGRRGDDEDSLPDESRLRTLVVMTRGAGWIALVALVAGCGGPASQGADAAPNADAPTLEPLPRPDGATAGYALSFDGVDDYATAGNAGSGTVADAMTIEMWVAFESGAGDQDFMVLRTEKESGVRIGIHAGTIAVRRVYVDRVLVQAPALPSVDVWHHIAYAAANWETHTLYVDGARVAEQTMTPDNRTPSSVWLGSIDGSSALYRGRMDEVRIWSITRSEAEVRADMQHGPAGGAAGLIAYWTFDDDGPGGRSIDSSGAGNDMTLGDGIAQRMPARVPSDAPAGN
jgi:hypothetical protein